MLDGGDYNECEDDEPSSTGNEETKVWLTIVNSCVDHLI